MAKILRAQLRESQKSYYPLLAQSTELKWITKDTVEMNRARWQVLLKISMAHKKKM